MKHSQVSLFIILGLALLLVTGMLIYSIRSVQQGQVENELLEQYIIKDDISPLKRYIESCIVQVTPEQVQRIGATGGVYNPVFFRYYNKSRLNYLSYSQQAQKTNSYLTRQDIEAELALEVKRQLQKCIDLGLFEKQKFDIEKGDINVTAKISKGRVIIDVNYPLTLKRGDAVFFASEFSAEISSPIGELYDLAIEIVNSELTNGYFDQVEYMKAHPDIVIEKHRPYPDIVYLIRKEGTNFNFAIEGENTVMQVGYLRQVKHDNGCCVNKYDGNCYKSTPSQICIMRGGVYEDNPECTCQTSKLPEKKNVEQKSCRSYDYTKKSFSGPVKQSGESWCVYDAKAGLGYDYVGSRHYRHYCIDGVEYVEECRDFREEICVESEGAGLTKSACRPNRWHDCYKCDTKECCENTDWRDCSWKEWLTTKSKCVPYVPPGFRFWEGNGFEVCSAATEIKECYGTSFSCPAIWIDDSAVYCYMQGDCGNYRNIADKITYYGYFNTDIRYSPRDYIFHKNGEIKNGHKYVIRLPDKRAQLPQESTRVVEAQNNFAMLIASAYSYLNEISSLSIMDFLNPFKPRPQIRIMDVAICSVWLPPEGSADCELCEAERLKPCTEYKCRSLGTGCIYSEDQGVPHCMPSKKDKTPPKVWLDYNSLTKGYSATKKELRISDKTYGGYEITPDLKPHKVFTIGLETDEDAICRLSYLPRLKFQMPNFFFGDLGYSKKHTIMVRVPPRAEIPQKLFDALNITKLSEIIRLLEEPKEFLLEYKVKFSGPIAAYKMVTGKDITKVIDPFIWQIISFIDELSAQKPFYKELVNTLLKKLDDGGLYLFVTCTDKSGNENIEEFFIEFSIDAELNDTLAPIILGTLPENQSLLANSQDELNIRVYTDEHAVCRYSTEDKAFEEMEHQLICPSSPYTMSYYFGGSYECTARLNAKQETKIYVRCMDNPLKSIKGEIKLESSEINSIVGTEPSKYLSIAEANIINASINMLSSDILFRMNATSIKIQLNMEEPMVCTLDYANATIPFEKCLPVNDLDAGLYACTVSVNLIEPNFDFFTFNITLINTSEELILPLGVNFSNKVLELWPKNTPVLTIGANETIKAILLLESGWRCNATICNENACIAELETNNSYLFMCTNIGISGSYSATTLPINCIEDRPSRHNVNAQSTLLVFKKSPPLRIIDYGPRDESGTKTVLFVKTSQSKNIMCGYTQGLTLEKMPMLKMDNTTFESHLKGLSKGKKTYIVGCNDEYGNTATQDIVFYVVE
ncbi:MAG: hypothetical protein QXK37_01395 [Candidatus Woesearchaeota archaeon]